MTGATMHPPADELLLQHCLAGLDAQQAGRTQQAIGHFADAVQVAPQNLDTRLLLAFAQGAAGEHDAARATLGATPQIMTLPSADARRLVDAATSLGADRVALAAVERVMVFSPADPSLHATLGALHHRIGDTATASLVLHRAHMRWPSHVPTLMNRARLLSDTGEHAEAIALYDQVLRHSASHAHARWYRGMLRLMLGQAEHGWRDHEARRQLPLMEVITPAGVPAWDGSELDGKSILLWGEQGLGDQIMGVRFANSLAARGAHVVVRCAASLVPVVRTVDGVAEVVAAGEDLPQCDVHVPMLSVPALCAMSDDRQLGGEAYMRPPQPGSSDLQLLLDRPVAGGNSRRKRVGIVWAGSATHGNDRNRSFPSSMLVELLGGADVEWLSLQVGPRRDELASLETTIAARVIDASPVLRDFGDTAQAIATCDMIVSVDTSVAHLSGALGIPTVLMLPFVPDWRWQIARRDTPWYRSVRLLRQPMAGAWSHVIREVHRAINSGAA